MPRGPSAPSRAALGRGRAGLGVWALNSIRLWSCQETENSKSREEGETPHLKDAAGGLPAGGSPRDPSEGQAAVRVTDSPCRPRDAFCLKGTCSGAVSTCARGRFTPVSTLLILPCYPRSSQVAWQVAGRAGFVTEGRPGAPGSLPLLGDLREGLREPLSAPLGVPLCLPSPSPSLPPERLGHLVPGFLRRPRASSHSSGMWSQTLPEC